MSELGVLLTEANSLYNSAIEAREKSAIIIGQAQKIFLIHKENIRAALFSKLENKFPFLTRKQSYNSTVNISETGSIWIWCIFRVGTLNYNTETNWENGKKSFIENFQEYVREILGLDQFEKNLININIQFDLGEDAW